MREDAFDRGSANDLTDAMRRLGQPIEASADVKPGCMHPSGPCSWRSASTRISGRRACGVSSGAYGAGRIVNPKTTRSQCIEGIGMTLMEHSVVDTRNARGWFSLVAPKGATSTLSPTDKAL